MVFAKERLMYNLFSLLSLIFFAHAAFSDDLEIGLLIKYILDNDLKISSQSFVFIVSCNRSPYQSD